MIMYSQCLSNLNKNRKHVFDVCRLCLLLLFFCLQACTNYQEIIVYDEHGEPISDVYVLSEIMPGFFTDWHRYHDISDENGTVKVLSGSSNTVFYKEGFYPLINGTVVPCVSWSNERINKEVAMFKLRDASLVKKIVIHASDEGQHLVKLDFEGVDVLDVLSVVYDVSKNEFLIKSSDVLTEAQKFYVENSELNSDNNSSKNLLIEGEKANFYFTNHGKKIKAVIVKNWSIKTNSGRSVLFEVRYTVIENISQRVFPNMEDWSLCRGPFLQYDKALLSEKYNDINTNKQKPFFIKSLE